MSKTYTPLTLLCRAQNEVTRIQADIATRQTKEDVRRQKFVDMAIIINERLAKAEAEVAQCQLALKIETPETVADPTDA